MGRKVGDLTQYIAQFVGSFVVAFYLSWKLTVVLIASIPAIGIAGKRSLHAQFQIFIEDLICFRGIYDQCCHCCSESVI